jgi:hypothetical protein
MFLGILTMTTALAISAVAIYYSVAGLVAIFAAAAFPIMIMGGILEIGKLITAVWLHYYWSQSPWWLRTYLSISVIVLMFITSMGIFGFLSKAHIEQTASATEGIAQIERIDAEIGRQQLIIETASTRIEEAQSSVGKNNETIQQQIDIEQQRIDTAYERIQPAIDEQNAVIESARAADAKRTEPFEQQLAALDEELRRLNDLAEQYEERITGLTSDNSAIDPILAQITAIQDSIVRVEGQLASGEREQIRQAQSTIGSNIDGSAGPNTRRAANAWIEQQRSRITELQNQISELRVQAQTTADVERQRLSNLIENIRGSQTDAIKSRQLEVLATIDNVRATESPTIQAARDEIARIRAGADAQILQSNTLIQSLRESLTIGKDPQVEALIADQSEKIAVANSTIDTLTEQKYQLQTEYRKLEAEVGPIKYLAEFIYGDTADKDLLEEAVRWVIIIIIFVFDPLAVLLLIASQYTFEFVKTKKKATKSKSDSWKDYEQARAQLIVANKEVQIDTTKEPTEQTGENTSTSTTSIGVGAEQEGRDHTQRMDVAQQGVEDDRPMEETNTDADATLRELVSENSVSDNDVSEQTMEQIEISTDADSTITEEELRKIRIDELEKTQKHRAAKLRWKAEHPDQNLKFWKDQYIKGKIDELPWENQSYQQNEEQSDSSIWKQIRQSNE